MEIRDVFFAAVIATLAVLTGLILRPFVSYVLAAGLLAFILMPAQRRLAPRLGRRVSAFVLVALAVVLTTVPLVVISTVIVTDAAEATEDIEERPLLDSLERLLGDVGLDVAVPEEVNTIPNQLLETFAGEFSGLLGATVKLLLGVSLLVFLLYYLLVDGPKLVAWVREITPLPAKIQDHLYTEANVITWAVLKGHVFVGIAQGVIGGVGFVLVGLPNPVFWTVVMVIFSFLPVIGVAAVWVPAAVYLLLTERFVEGAFLFVYGATAIGLVDNYLRAYLVDRGSGLHPAVVMVGVVGGIYFLGALGLFLGPVILAIFKATLVVFDESYDA